MLDCDKTNTSSARTIISLGGILTKEEYNEEATTIVQDYWIDVKESLANNVKYEENVIIKV